MSADIPRRADFDWHQHFNETFTGSVRTAGIVNITADDFSRLTDLKSDNLYSIMLLPEHYASEPEKADSKVELLRSLIASDGSLLVGEAGLDRRFADKVSLDFQAKVFEKVVSIASEFSRKIVIHSVRCDYEVYSVLKRFKLSGGIWHGFHESVQFAKKLGDFGIIPSLGLRYKYFDSFLSQMRDLGAVTESDAGEYKSTEEKARFQMFSERFYCLEGG